MIVADVPEVGRLERRCFSNPWPASAYRRELQVPEQNYYIVLRDREPGTFDSTPALASRNGAAADRELGRDPFGAAAPARLELRLTPW